MAYVVDNHNKTRAYNGDTIEMDDLIKEQAFSANLFYMNKNRKKNPGLSECSLNKIQVDWVLI
jgi:hypothetical protein